MAKTKEISITEDGQVKTFVLSKPSAKDAFDLVLKASLALGAAGLKMPEGVMGMFYKMQSMIAEAQNNEKALDELIRLLCGLDYFLIKPIFDEMDRYITYKATGTISRPANLGDDGDIENWNNLLTLYIELGKLTLGF